MRRATGLILLALVLATGVAVGVLGRTWLDGQQGEGSSVAAPGAVSTGVPAAAPPPPAAPTVAPASGDLVVEVTESEVQTQMSTMLVGRSLGTTPLGETTIQTVTVAFRDRQIRVGGNARTGFVQAPFTADGTIAPDPNGRPLIRVTEATVGGVQLPDGARAALADTLQTQVDQLFADRAMKIRSIDIADGKLRLVGTAGS